MNVNLDGLGVGDVESLSFSTNFIQSAKLKVNIVERQVYQGKEVNTESIDLVTRIESLIQRVTINGNFNGDQVFRPLISPGEVAHHLHPLQVTPGKTYSTQILHRVHLHHRKSHSYLHQANRAKRGNPLTYQANRSDLHHLIKQWI